MISKLIQVPIVPLLYTPFTMHAVSAYTMHAVHTTSLQLQPSEAATGLVVQLHRICFASAEASVTSCWQLGCC